MTNDGWKIDFDDVTQYNEFCERVAQIVARDLRFDEDLAEDVAAEIIYRHVDDLASAVFKRLIDRAIANTRRD